MLLRVILTGCVSEKIRARVQLQLCLGLSVLSSGLRLFFALQNELSITSKVPFTAPTF